MRNKNALYKVDLDGGINLLEDPRRIRDNELVATKNLAPNISGMLSVRPSTVTTGLHGMVYPEGVLGLPASFQSILPFSSHYVELPGWDTQFLAFMHAGSQHTFAVMGRLSEYLTDQPALRETTSLEERFAFARNNVAPCVVPYLDAVWVAAGVEGLIKISRMGSSSEYSATVKAFEGAANELIFPKVMTLYRNHFAMANLGTGYENAILISADGDPLTIGDNALAANGRYFTVGTPDDEIVGLIEVAMTAVGTPVQNALLVLKRRSAALVTGLPSEPGVTFDLLDLSVSHFAFDCGCAGPWTISRTPYGIAWAGQDDVWVFTAGQVPVRVGTKIRPVLETAAKDLTYKWHGVYHNGFYKLAVGATSHDGSCPQQFWLDMRNDVPPNFKEARWWGPMEFNVICPTISGHITQPTQPDEVEVVGTYNMFAVPNVGVGPDIFTIGVNSPTVEGIVTGTAQGVFSVSLNGSSNVDGTHEISWVPDTWTTGETYEEGDIVKNSLEQAFVCTGAGDAGASEPEWEDEINVDDGTVTWEYLGSIYEDPALWTGDSKEIAIELRSKEFDFGDPMIRKIIQGVEVDINVDGPTQLDWSVYADGAARINVNNPDTLEAPGWTVNLNTLDGDRFTREFQAVNLSVPSSQRLTGKTHQIVLSESSGICVIEDYNDKIICGVAPFLVADPFADAVVATIPAGRYQTSELIDALCEAVVDAIDFGSLNVESESSYRLALKETWIGGGALVGLSSKESDLPVGSEVSAEVLHRCGLLFGMTADTRYTSAGNALQYTENTMPHRDAIQRVNLAEIRFKLRMIPRRPV